jgi:hypothetical protein
MGASMLMQNYHKPAASFWLLVSSCWFLVAVDTAR